MKKKNLAIVGAVVVLAALALLFFSTSKEERFVEQEISSMKEKGSYIHSLIKEEEKTLEETYPVSLPPESEKDYVDFLAKAMSKIDFDVKTKDKRVSISFEPANLKKTMEPLLKKEEMEISSPVFSEAIQTLLEKETKELDHLKRQTGTTVVFELKENEEGYSIPKEDAHNLIRAALPGYLDTYLVLEDVFDKQQYLIAFLDAYLKGETEKLADHLHMPKEEVDTWYREGFEGAVEGFSDEDATRLTNALMSIAASSKYEVGIPRKNEKGEYDIAIKITPNLSSVKAKEEIDAMEFSSKEEVVEGYLAVYEKYAQNPVYGDPFDSVFHWDANTTFGDLQPGTYVGDFLGSIFLLP